MHVHKKIVTDENQQPIAVQIDYEDWIKIERELHLHDTNPVTIDPKNFAGTIGSWGEDAVAYQRRVREEWPQ
jgi:hypothetical protein